MRKLLIALLLFALPAAEPAMAQDDALGLYFSDSTFSLATASRANAPGFVVAAYIVLTNPTGAVVSGYEVGVSSTAADFAVPVTSLIFDINLGSNTNQLVSFMFPKPTAAGGTVLAMIGFSTASVAPETIAFAAATPSSLPGVLPVVNYGAGRLVACSQPYGTPVVAWLNGQPVAAENATWGAVKSTFR